MAEPHDAADQRLEEIVAYLDGELSPEASARVERLLASDEDFRQQLQGIERAWQALDELPLTTVDDCFSRTTMEMAVQIVQEELQQRTNALPIVRRRTWLSTVLAATAVAALGFLIVRLALRQPDRLLLADLPVIDNIDVYTQFKQVDFLRQLRQEFGPELADLAGAPVDLEERVARFQVAAAMDQRESWVRGLDAAERTNLRAKYYRFRELPQAEQERLRQLHQSIMEAEDAAELERTMLAYHAWLSGLPPAQQFELRTIDSASQRIQTIERWAEEMQEDALFTLSDEEVRNFATNMHKAMAKVRAAGDRMREARGQGRVGPGQRRGAYMAAGQFADENAERFQTAVLDALPTRVREPFKGLSPQQKLQQVGAWMRQAESLGRGPISQQELERFFAEEVDVDTREYLLSLPPEQMEQALEWRYRRQTELCFDGRRKGDRDGRDDRDERNDRGDRRDGDDRRGPPGDRDAGGPPRGPGLGRGLGPDFGGPGGLAPPKGFGPPPDGPRRPAPNEPPPR